MPQKDPHSLKRCLLILSISLFSFANVAFAEPTHLVVSDSPNADDWSIQDRLVVGQETIRGSRLCWRGGPKGIARSAVDKTCE